VAGAIAPLEGSRIAHKDLVIGYFAQHTVDQLKSGRTPLQHLTDIAPGLGEQVGRNYLGRWNFVGDRVFENVDGFSGGERARLALALIAWTKPNLLLLDEPTNHLDLEMREALAEALNDFEGAIVLVSHDRSLLGLVCDSFWRVADAAVEPFDGDLDDYARWLRKRRSEGDGAKPKAPSATAAPRDAERRRDAADQREREKPLRQRLKAIDTRLSAIATERSGVDARLADSEATSRMSTADLAKLAQQQGLLRAEQERLEEEWLTVSAELEGLAAG
jgi:ATP-binding cassette subfamily F protein 3